jgi:hypothetical protein
MLGIWNFFVYAPKPGCCWICGRADGSTREHKFKASDLQRHFGRDEMHVFTDGDFRGPARVAQGPKSDHLKFQSPICEVCNSSLTQESDRAYDAFIKAVERRPTRCT